MGQIGSRKESLCSGQKISDGQTKGQMDGQTDHFKSHAKWGPRNSKADVNINNKRLLALSFEL